MTKTADKSFSKLDKPTRQRIIDFFEDRVLPSGNPRRFGKRLVGHWSGLWSYRIGDYRVIADIQDHRVTIVATDIAHRKQIYDFYG
jgi:mRNA interferase RelE/StbE